MRQVTAICRKGDKAIALLNGVAAAVERAEEAVEALRRAGADHVETK